MERSTILQLIVIGALIVLNYLALQVGFFPDFMTLPLQLLEFWLIVAFGKQCGIAI